MNRKDNRLSMPQSIVEAIEIMNTFSITNIEKAISRAESELNIALLKAFNPGMYVLRIENSANRLFIKK